MKKLFLTRLSGLRASLGILLLGLGFASVVVVALQVMGFEAITALRDRALSDSPVAGLLSDTGIVLTGLAGSVALVRGVIARSLPLGLLGVFCGLFMLDDALLLHEGMGAFEIVFFGFYGVLALFILAQYRRATGQLPWPFVLVVAAFGVSVVIDVLWDPAFETMAAAFNIPAKFSGVGFILEDVPKFGGIVVLACFALGDAALLRKGGQSSVS